MINNQISNSYRDFIERLVREQNALLTQTGGDEAARRKKLAAIKTALRSAQRNLNAAQDAERQTVSDPVLGVVMAIAVALMFWAPFLFY